MRDGETQAKPADDWQEDWEGHRRHQLTMALAATPAERLAWLEEMIVLAWRTGALPKRTTEAEDGEVEIV